jgi:hypothetical protein
MFVCSVWPPLPAVRHRVERGQRYIPQDRRFGNDYNGRPCAATLTVEVTRSRIVKRNMDASLVSRFGYERPRLRLGSLKRNHGRA